MERRAVGRPRQAGIATGPERRSAELGEVAFVQIQTGRQSVRSRVRRGEDGEHDAVGIQSRRDRFVVERVLGLALRLTVGATGNVAGERARDVVATPGEALAVGLFERAGVLARAETAERSRTGETRTEMLARHDRLFEGGEA